MKNTSIILLCSLIPIVIASGAECEDSAVGGTLRIAAETLFGGAGGMAAVYALYSLDIGSARPTQDNYIRSRLIPDYAAMALGSTVGVYLIGIIDNETGSFMEETESFLSTFGSSVLGLLVFGGCILINGRPINVSGDFDSYSCCLAPGGLFSALTGAVIGFNVTRDLILGDESGGRMASTAPSIRLDMVRMRF